MSKIKKSEQIAWNPNTGDAELDEHVSEVLKAEWDSMGKMRSRVPPTHTTTDFSELLENNTTVDV